MGRRLPLERFRRNMDLQEGLKICEFGLRIDEVGRRGVNGYHEMF